MPSMGGKGGGLGAGPHGCVLVTKEWRFPPRNKTRPDLIRCRRHWRRVELQAPPGLRHVEHAAAQRRVVAQEPRVRRPVPATRPPPPPPPEDKTQPVILTLRRCCEGIPPLTSGPRCLEMSKAPCGVMVCPLPRACLIVRRLRRAY